MPTDPPLVDPKGEKPLRQCEGEFATLEATDPSQINSLHIEMGKNVVILYLLDLISGRPDYKEQEILYYLGYTIRLLQCCYPNARQKPYEISGKPFCAVSW